ncbi:MAG: TIGR01777 family oxidoreductase [Bacteroidales bacterium]
MKAKFFDKTASWKTGVIKTNQMQDSNKILITGGSGLIGQELSKKLLQKGYEVAVLSRNKKTDAGIKTYQWDPLNNEIEKEAIETAGYIIHLAGANLSDKRWTGKRKQIIVDSRVKSADLLFDKVMESNNTIKAFISASAINYYGTVTSDKIFSENDTPGDDFLGETCRKWEKSANRFSDQGIRTVIIRTGVVLSGRGGALKKMETPVKLGIGSPIGSGRQYLPWIHLDDICNIYIKAIEDKNMHGAFNAVAPDIPTNGEFMKTLARAYKKPFWAPAVPAPLMKLLFGEMSSVLLEGSRVSTEKISESGFEFRFPELENALSDLISK